METALTYLDGNATAGPLGDILGFDITTTVGRCAGCRGAMQMAQCRAYSAGPGLVLRCAACDCVLLRLVVAKDRAWLDMSGLTCLQIARTESG